MRDNADRVRISGIGVLQWGLIGALSTFVVAVLLVIVVFAGASRFLPTMPTGPMAAAQGVGMAIGLLVVYPIMGFIGGIIGAWIYNLAGLIMGGLEIEVSG